MAIEILMTTLLALDTGLLMTVIADDQFGFLGSHHFIDTFFIGASYPNRFFIIIFFLELFLFLVFFLLGLSFFVIFLTGTFGLGSGHGLPNIHLLNFHHGPNSFIQFLLF